MSTTREVLRRSAPQDDEACHVVGGWWHEQCMKRNCIYVMANACRSVLYIGVTSDLWRRRVEHRQEKADGGFCGKYQVHDVIYVEWIPDIRDAIKREKALKGKTRAKKLALIREVNPHLDSLSPPYFSLPKM